MPRNPLVLYRFSGPWGVRVELSPSLFLLMLVFVSIGETGDIFWSLSLFMMVMVSVYLHELGHAAACVIQGVPIRRIVLHGGGGFCEHGRSAGVREQELIVAAGPLVNLSLWAVFSLVSMGSWAMFDSSGAVSSGLSLAALGWGNAAIYAGTFATVNLALFVYNMIPVQPMDGGKLLHLALVRRTSPMQASRATGSIGFAFAIAWIPIMIVLYLTVGWILLFFPSVRHHLAMLKGKIIA